MTDQIPTLSPEEAAGRALVARTSFEKEAVWLPSLAVQHWNAGQMAIDGKTFTDCVIEGPAVVAVMNGTTFDNCAMGTTSDVRNLLYRPLSTTKLAGVVGMSNCRFVRCRFAQVGFTGSDDLLEQLRGGVKSMSDVATPSGTLA
ncbi:MULTISPECIES: hypothetical protein [unclassified Brevundimonas]|uniref:hypothetical protein n=1 Tax=unclassified Brevundimonas TaxID=2622653 RepID=UPI0006F8F3D9|nr:MULTISPECIES: hypothetical protein [unclassified Brevundimonas]KQY88099.1 hypothetical protein ASD25_21300 [Brevundimonas sp. Root1423]KRA28601.1 hypothetical protein ASD59_01880 [Brevundimonas sp. Root608]